jgi:hypothetical protein
MAVGSESIGQDEGVTPVVLGTAQSMPVAESVDLLGVDGEDRDTAFQKSLHDGSMRFLDGDRDALGVVLGDAQEPIDDFR